MPLLDNPNSPNLFRIAGLCMVGLLLLALGYLAFETFVLAPRRQAAELAVVAKIVAEAPRGQAASLPVANQSIAVLPFVDMSPGKDQEYMSDGISEELLNLLAKIPQLRVIARTSSFSFKGKEMDAATIARTLNVDHLLEGSLRKSGNRIRITAQLIRASDSSQLWSETYDRKLDDVFGVQDEISAAVVAQLRIKLLGAAPAASKASPASYSLFLQARQLYRQGTAEGYEQSIALYQKALAMDPGYAPGWVGLASAYTNQTASSLRPVDEGYRLAREAVERSLAIDPDSAPAFALLGWIAINYDNDLAAAARYLDRALVLAPEDIGTLLNSAQLAKNLGRIDQAIALDEIVIARDPVNSRAQFNLGLDYYYAGRLDDAIDRWRTTLALSPGFIGANQSIGAALRLEGRAEEALSETLKESSELWRSMGLATVYHALGRKTEADAELNELIGEHGKDAAYNIAAVLAFRGDADRAFEWLDKAVEYHDGGLADVALDLEFAGLHKDPRWLPFLRRVGKAPEQLAAIKFEKLPAKVRDK